jgi:hypothetical protein
MAHPGPLDIRQDDLRAWNELPIRASQSKPIEELQAAQQGRIIDVAARLMKLPGRQSVPRIPRQFLDRRRKSFSLQDTVVRSTGLLFNLRGRRPGRLRGKTSNLTTQHQVWKIARHRHPIISGQPLRPQLSMRLCRSNHVPVMRHGRQHVTTVLLALHVEGMNVEEKVHR